MSSARTLLGPSSVLVFVAIAVSSASCAARTPSTPGDGTGTDGGLLDAPPSRVDAADSGASVPTDGSASPDLNVRVCSSGETTCSDGVLRVCRSDGRAFDTFEFDATQDLRCEANTCRGACSPTVLGSSYIGCDYYPTMTANPVHSSFKFGVAVANAHTENATVTVTRGDDVVLTRTLPPGAVEMLELDWVSELKGPDWGSTTMPIQFPSRLVTRGAYRIRSTRPITAYQYNPIKYTLGNTFPVGCHAVREVTERGEECLSVSNDSSLLFPATALGTDYTVAAWQSQAGQSMMAITATQNDTRVTVDSPEGVLAIPLETGDGIDMNGDGTVMLNAGDVLQVLSPIPRPDAGRPFGEIPNVIGSDFTGARVTANAAIQVIAGNSCAFVPQSTTRTCDHLEEAMLPRLALGSEYVATTFGPAQPTATGGYTLRVIGIVPGTTVQVDPPITIAGRTTSSIPLEAGTVFELQDVRTDARLTGNNIFLAVRYMQGWSANGLDQTTQGGDPSLITLAPTRQFRDSYVFFTSNTYDANWVNVIARTGTSVSIDDIAIPDTQFVAIGTTAYRVARYRLGATQGHTARGTGQFGIEVYGYGLATSYAYPGGLDLLQRPF